MAELQLPKLTVRVRFPSPAPPPDPHSGTLRRVIGHETFAVERVLHAPADRVLAAFAEDARRRRWIRMPGSAASYDHDFRVGGGETARSAFPHGDGRIERLENRSTYLRIEPDLLAYAYTAYVDDRPTWSALVTVELDAVGDGGTRLTWTEQVAFSDPGPDDLPHLVGGVRLRLNGLPAAIA